MKYRTKLLRSHRRQLVELLGDQSREQACFLLTRSAIGDGETILLVVDVLPLAPEDFLVQEYDVLSVAPSALLRVMRRAEAAGCGVCMVHSHPMADSWVAFSHADDIGNRKTFSYYCALLPDSIHSCLVWNGALTHVQGRVHHDGHHWEEQDRVEVVDDEVWQVFYDSAVKSPRPKAGQTYHRQAKLLGAAGQATVEKLRLTVIGAGGVGSLVSIMLGHSGAERQLSIDPDVMKDVNLPRQIGAGPEDVDKSLKVAVLERYLRACCPQVSIEVHPGLVQDEDIQRKLISSDAIICATDDDSSRAWLNQLSQQYFVPLLDLGVEFDCDPDSGEIRGDVGKVNLVLPGTPCLMCTGHIDTNKVTWESLPREAQVNQIKAGYIRNWLLEAPSSMAFNATVAARGVQLLLGHFTGLIPTELDSYERYTFLTGDGLRHHSRVRKRQQGGCIFCSDFGFAGQADLASQSTEKPVLA